MNKPELLAPAGSFEKAKTAFRYGADAIYAGTSSLSLRTRADMTDNDLVKTIKYAHEIGKRVYVTINIFPGDETYEEIANQAMILNELNVDGIIVADGGVVDLIKEVAPDVDIHISTQANTVSLQSSRFWYRNGAKRIILGRELNKNQIKYITENKPNGLETEIFVHGAVCFGYSGRCFLSEYLASRNANLGDCAQSCRWAYNLYVEEKNKPGNMMPVEYDENGTYIFSSKDLCLIENIPEIIEMGVDSLKIEGRLKTEYYLATVINTYRHAVDDYMMDPENYDAEKYKEELEKTKTRGLTTFYFNDKNNKDFQDYTGNQHNVNYEYGGKVLETLNDGKVVLEIKNRLQVGDTLEIIMPESIEPIEFDINKLWDIETSEEIEFVNPGRAGQKVKLLLPLEVEDGIIIRKKKAEN